MINGKKIAVVMPAYNAEKTIETTYREVPREYIDEVILVDDASRDKTSDLAFKLGIDTLMHTHNQGYGGNQKTCYQYALNLDADVVVMLHPDYQYTPRLLVAMASMVAFGEYDVVLGSRILCGGALKGGMPLYKYIFNRMLTFMQNLLMGSHMSEFHTGYRAFSKDVLLTLPLKENSNNFVFDNQMVAQALFFGFSIGEISCPTRYFAEASSISFWPSMRYGLGVLQTAVQYFLQKRLGIRSYAIFSTAGRKLRAGEPPVAEVVRPIEAKA